MTTQAMDRTTAPPHDAPGGNGHTTGPTIHHVALAWRTKSRELAEVVFPRFVNRTGVWGGYFRQNGSIQRTTCPAKVRRGKEALTPSLLQRHFGAADIRHLVGLHTTSLENTSRWGAVDIDAHEGEVVDRQANIDAALSWYESVSGRGFNPLLWDSNGDGGYHLTVLFSSPVETWRVFALLQELVADYKDFGFASPPETFPKQPKVDAGRYGNWLRLFGKHHKRDHYSRLYTPDSGWLVGAGRPARSFAAAPKSPL